MGDEVETEREQARDMVGLLGQGHGAQGVEVKRRLARGLRGVGGGRGGDVVSRKDALGGRGGGEG